MRLLRASVLLRLGFSFVDCVAWAAGQLLGLRFQVFDPDPQFSRFSGANESHKQDGNVYVNNQADSRSADWPTSPNRENASTRY